MTDHLTEKQIAAWVLGRLTDEGRLHLQTCLDCAGKAGAFRRALDMFRADAGNRAGNHPAAAAPTLRSIRQACEAAHLQLGPTLSNSRFWWSSIVDQLAERIRPGAPATDIPVTVGPAPVADLWSRDNSGYAGLLSVGLHALLIFVLVIPAVKAYFYPAPVVTSVVELAPASLILNLPRFETRPGSESAGGGGGGMKTPAPPSRGELPRGAERQILPPAVEIKNLAPDLVVEPTVVAPQLANLPPLPIMQFGDPNGIVGPPSQGPGEGGGIGTGKGTGIGPGDGPGVGPGADGGIGGGAYSVGGGVSAPVPLYKPSPGYSEDGRKGRIQGSVELLVIVNADGSVTYHSTRRSLGYGLDQKAVEAVSTWRFDPGEKDGAPVATWISVTVNFSLR